jgi:hemolysin activation/secretion protein
MNKFTVSLLSTVTIYGSLISAFAETSHSSPGADLEAIKRSYPLLESLEVLSEKARKNLLESSSSTNVTEMIEKIVLPAAWTDMPQCLTVDYLVFDKTWGREKVVKNPWREIQLPDKCLERHQYLVYIRSAVQDLANQGYLVTSVNPEQDIEGHTVHVSFHLMALDQFVFQDSASAGYLKGLELKEGEPINLHALDELIERMTRLRSNDPHLNISPSTDYKFAALNINNVRNSKNFYFDGGITDRRGARIQSASFSSEDTLGQREVLSLSGQYTLLPSGNSSLKTVAMEIPVKNTFLSIAYTEGGSHTSFSSNNSEHAWLSNDRSTKVGIYTNIYRNQSAVWSFIAGLKIKNTQTWIDEYLTESQSPKLTVGEFGLSLKYLLDSQSFFSSDLNFKSGMSILGAQLDSNITEITRSDAHAQFEALSSTSLFSSPINLLGKNFRWISIVQLFHAQQGLYPGEQFLMSSPTGVEGFFKSQTLADKAMTLKTSLSSEWTVPWLSRPLRGIVSYAYADGVRYVDSEKNRLRGAGLQISYGFEGGLISCTSYLPVKNVKTANDSASFNLTLQLTY